MWDINQNAYDRWVEGKTDALSPSMNLSKPSVRALVAMALLEKEDGCSYDEINSTLLERGVFRLNQGTQQIPVPTLRVAVSELSRCLKKHGRFQLQTERMGRTSRFRLLRLRENNKGATSQVPVRPFPLPETEPRAITRGLVRDGGGLPFASLYSTYRAAAWWLSFSTHQAMLKKQYEADMFDHAGIAEKFLKDSPKNVGVVSLAPGEGLGEVEILDRIFKKLQEKKNSSTVVHYLAIDTSDILLMSHSRLITEKFTKELESGQLVYLPVVGDLYQLDQYVTYARDEKGAEFLSGPIVCTYLGNCIGNSEGDEWPFYITVCEAFQENKDLAIMVGASVLRLDDEGNPIDEKYTLDPFLLETPRHLMYDLGLMKSIGPGGETVPNTKNSEFVFVEGESPEQYIPAQQYHTPLGIQGQVYRFYYTLKNRLESWDGKQTLVAGAKILLYSIIKYDVESIVEMLRARSFKVLGPPNELPYKNLAVGEEKFKYAVVVAFK